MFAGNNLCRGYHPSSARRITTLIFVFHLSLMTGGCEGIGFANVILFLASVRAIWVSAAVIPVDGGFLHRENWF
jgi:hypothetical protein